LLGGILAFINPKYMALLWTTDIGQSLMIGGLLLMSLGALWMWKITRIKV
jgi:tight adherence protein B